MKGSESGASDTLPLGYPPILLSKGGYIRAKYVPVIKSFKTRVQKRSLSGNLMYGFKFLSTPIIRKQSEAGIKVMEKLKSEEAKNKNEKRHLLVGTEFSKFENQNMQKKKNGNILGGFNAYQKKQDQNVGLVKYCTGILCERSDQEEKL